MKTISNRMRVKDTQRYGRQCLRPHMRSPNGWILCGMLLGRIPFPVCVLFMSFCVILGTSGAPFMDCLVCDRTACDSASADVQFTEDVLYLPEPYFMVPTDVDTVDSSTGTVCMWSTLHVRFQVLYTTTVYTVAAMYLPLEWMWLQCLYHQCTRGGSYWGTVQPLEFNLRISILALSIRCPLQ